MPLGWGGTGPGSPRGGGVEACGSTVWSTGPCPAKGAERRAWCPSLQGGAGRIFPFGKLDGLRLYRSQWGRRGSPHRKSVEIFPPNLTSLGGAFSAGRQPEGALPYLKEGEKGIFFAAGSHPEGNFRRKSYRGSFRRKSYRGELPPEVTQRGNFRPYNSRAVGSNGQETNEKGCSCNRKWAGGALPSKPEAGVSDSPTSGVHRPGN